MRGLAILLMFENHAYESWLSPQAKETTFYTVARFLGGYPAPLFLFVAGAALALVAERRRASGASRRSVALAALGRSVEVLVYAILFRLWMYWSYDYRGPEDLFRVDILNCIGLSLALVAALVLPLPSRWWPQAAAALAAAIGLATPWTWDGPMPTGVSPGVLAYVNGRLPGAFFPVFPWAGFAALGAGVGFSIHRARATKGGEALLVKRLGIAAICAIALALLFGFLPTFGPREDFWWTSPRYFAIKCAVVVIVLGLAFAYDGTRLANGPSLLRTLGGSSLLVYWVHIEIVYGKKIAPDLQGRLTLGEATLRLLGLVTLMGVLAFLRSRSRGGVWRSRHKPAAQTEARRPPA